MSNINDKTAENNRAVTDENFVKDFILAMEKEKQEEYNSLSKETKNKISIFVENALTENMTEDELMQCLKYMPAKLAELVCFKLPKELSTNLLSALNKMYTDEFIADCKNSKTGAPKIKSISSYKQSFKINSNIRFIDYYEILGIALGLGYPLDKLLFGNIESCKDDYQRMLKMIHAKMFKNNYRDQEYKFMQIYNEKFIDVALDNQKELLNKRHNI